MRKYFVLVIVSLFILFCIAFYELNLYVPTYDLNLLIGGNVIIAALTIATYFIVQRQIHERPQAFIRGVYGATFLKLMVCMVSIFTYIVYNRQHIHKPSIFVLFGLYAVYTAIETWLVSKMAREKK